MNKNPNIEELVGRYLEGEMSEHEKLNFEQNLTNDPGLQEELQFQKDIVEGIQEYRKAELKARLDNIQIPSSTIYQYIGLKVAALITITTMIGFGAYFTFFNNGQQSQNNNMLAIDQKKQATPEVVVPEIPVPKEESFNTEDIKVEKADKKEKRNKDKDGGKVSEKKEKASTVKSEQTDVSNLPSPNIVKPESVEGIADEKIEHKDDSFEVSNNSLNAVNKVFENKVEVETISGTRKDFHYQFYNRKLFLYGDFDKMPYEIIEYNANQNKLYFLYYEGKFYGLKSEQMKVTPLEEITDADLITELEELRK